MPQYTPPNTKIKGKKQIKDNSVNNNNNKHWYTTSKRKQSPNKNQPQTF
jgi:hypothetical protein